MCTVSFLPTADGFLLAVNRDELRTRPTALPPDLARTGELRSLYPREPGGGAWLGVNEAGLAFALLNWHTQPPRGPTARVSRGTVIPALLAADGPLAVEEILGGLDVAAMNPFRLVMAAASGRVLAEWRADGSDALVVAPLSWRRTHWFSSSFDEPGVNRLRAEACRREAWVSPPRTLAWLRDLHGSHHPIKGAFSICMHRGDAETVSCTELAVDPAAARMTYSAGPACEPGRASPRPSRSGYRSPPPPARPPPRNGEGGRPPSHDEAVSWQGPGSARAPDKDRVSFP